MKRPDTATAALFVLAASLYASYRGLGLPNHPYQWSLGFLGVALAYHRGWLAWRRHPLTFFLAGLNVCQIAMLLKLLIGSGRRYPFAWMEYPNGFQVSSMSFTWQSPNLATWQLDLTLIQTFLFLVTVAGAVVRFQPFTSLTAILLLVASLPAFSSFDWAWVFPAMMAAGVALYLQAPCASRSVSA